MHEFNDEIDITSFNPFLHPSESIYKVNITIPSTDFFFPNKLNNLHGYTYKVLIFHQPPRLNYGKKIVYGVDTTFLMTIAQQQNARISQKLLDPNQKKFKSLFMYSMLNDIVDFTLNTALKSYLAEVNTYDENGFCAMIPNPPRTSFLEFILKPFDTSTWICMILSISTCGLLWALFNCMEFGNSNSAAYFMFGVIANFVGQSVPFRSNRIIQVIIWQICVFMTFTLFASNFNSIVDPIFYNIMHSSGDHPWFTNNMIKASGVFDELSFEMLSLNNTALIMRCDGANAFYYERRFHKLHANVNEFYYLLPDKMHPFYEKFQVSKNCPFEKFLKHKTLTVFESGIRQHWKSTLDSIDSKPYVEDSFISNENYLLNMKDLYGVFYILIIGFILASIILTIEIFVHDCISNLNFSKLYENFQKKLFRLSQKKVTKMQIRRIQVIPAASVIDNTCDQV